MLIALIQQTLQQQKELKANEGKKDYRKPSRVYELPNPTECENPHIVSDTRTASEKKQDENQKALIPTSKVTEPESYFVTFKVVGIFRQAAVTNLAEMDKKAWQYN